MKIRERLKKLSYSVLLLAAVIIIRHIYNATESISIS